MSINLREIPKYGTLDISVESSLFGEKLEGSFKVRRRTLGDVESVARELSIANNGLPFASQNHAGILNAVYELAKVIEDAPEWWKPILEALDEKVVVYVYGAYLDWLRNPFRKAGERQAS